MAGPQSSSTPLINPPAIYINQTDGFILNGIYSNTIIGTPSLPVNNITDAKALAALRNTNIFHIVGTCVADQDIEGYIIQGTAPTFDIFNFAGYNFTNTTFQYLDLVGFTASPIFVNTCILGNNTPNSCYMQGEIFDSVLLGLSVFPTAFIATWRCILGNFINVDDGQLFINNGQGNLDVQTLVGAAGLINVLRGDMDILLQAGCTAGVAYITGNNLRVTDQSAGTLLFSYPDYPNPEVAINTAAILLAEIPILMLPLIPDPFGYTPRFTVDNIFLKCADPGIGNDVIVRLKKLINGVLTTVKTFTIGTGGAPNPFTNYYSQFDMFGLQQICGDYIVVTVQQEVGGGPTAVTGSLRYKTA